jgi:hypothetical protein
MRATADCGTSGPADARVSSGRVMEVPCESRCHPVNVPQQRGCGNDDGFGRFRPEFQANRFAAVSPLRLTDLVIGPLFGTAVGHRNVQGRGGDCEG